MGLVHRSSSPLAGLSSFSYLDARQAGERGLVLDHLLVTREGEKGRREGNQTLFRLRPFVFFFPQMKEGMKHKPQPQRETRGKIKAKPKKKMNTKRNATKKKKGGKWHNHSSSTDMLFLVWYGSVKEERKERLLVA